MSRTRLSLTELESRETPSTLDPLDPGGTAPPPPTAPSQLPATPDPSPTVPPGDPDPP